MQIKLQSFPPWSLVEKFEKYFPDRYSLSFSNRFELISLTFNTNIFLLQSLIEKYPKVESKVFRGGSIVGEFFIIIIFNHFFEEGP